MRMGKTTNGKTIAEIQYKIGFENRHEKILF